MRLLMEPVLSMRHSALIEARTDGSCNQRVLDEAPHERLTESSLGDVNRSRCPWPVTASSRQSCLDVAQRHQRPPLEPSASQTRFETKYDDSKRLHAVPRQVYCSVGRICAT